MASDEYFDKDGLFLDCVSDKGARRRFYLFGPHHEPRLSVGLRILRPGRRGRVVRRGRTRYRYAATHKLSLSVDDARRMRDWLNEFVDFYSGKGQQEQARPAEQD